MDINSSGIQTPEKTPCNDNFNIGGWFIAIFLFSWALFVLGSAVWSGWDSYTYKQVESSEDIGSITGASYSSSFSLNTSAIQTTTGTYVGSGFIQAVNGHHMRIEKRRNGERALCDVETDACIKMLGQ